MSKTATHTLLGIIAALNEREAASTVPEDNPLHGHTLTDLVHGAGIRKSADHIPARNMAAHDPDSPAAFNMEAARFEGRTSAKADKSAKRMAQAHARAARKIEFDKIARQQFTPDPERMDRAWLVVFHMVAPVSQIARSKQQWANRLLGVNADDIVQMTLESMALVLAKSDKDLDLLRTAASQLGTESRKSGKVPGDQKVTPEEREVRKARKWLMGMANNRVMGALVDSYTSQENLRWDNLDLIATVMASISGVGDDPMTSRFKANRSPAFLGARFQRPGGIDANVMATAISAAITEHGLDPMVEFILDDDHRRMDGAVKWSKHAQEIFLLTPGGHGAWLWQHVESATEQHGHARKARGDKARQHVRNLFEFLPTLIVRLVDAFDPQFLGWCSDNRLRRAILASDFELFYLPGLSGLTRPRQVLEPKLKYGSVEEAALALTEHLALLTSGTNIVKEAMNT